MKRYINILRTLFNITNKNIKIVIQMFISYGLHNLASLLPPIATSGIIAVVTQNNINGIWIYVLMYIIFYIMYFSSLHWNYYTYKFLANYYHVEVQKKLFNHVANNDDILHKISKGKITETCGEDIRYLVDVVDCASMALMDLLKLIIIFIIFMQYNLLVATFVLILDLLYLTLMIGNSKKVAKYYEGSRKYDDKLMDTFTHMITNLKQVKGLNLMPKLNLKLDRSRSRWSKEYANKMDYTTKRYCSIPYIVYIGKILLYIFLGYLVVNKKMSIDKLILLISYFEMTITCMDTMLENLLNLDNYGIRVNRIKTILDYIPSKEIEFGTINNDYINGLVEFRNVNYIVKGKMILDNVSFKLLPNEINTIVGHSGSGKTTIINLLYRLNKIKSGEILIDNENIYNYSKKVYSSNVNGVFQYPFIFEMSIKDNLSLMDTNIENQISACTRVGIHDFIMSLPKGYNTVITEDCPLLNDGDKQLLVIARALLSKAEILLFDEVTSNVDPTSTSKIADILLDLKTDHTIVLVTHKPEMMKISDRIIVLDEGKIVCEGTNDFVYKRCKLYKELRNRVFASISVTE